MLLTVVSFIIVIGILVLVHEFGHFLMAKKAGLKIEEFGFGFPPRLWGKKKGETIYSVNLIPFGGFVRILGEDGREEKNIRSFASRSAGIRTGIIAAGVTMNILLAFVLLSLVNVWGLRIGLTGQEAPGQTIIDKKVQILEVAPDSPAQQAGLGVLDEIIGFKINGEIISVTDVPEVQSFVKEHSGQSVVIQIRRGREITEKEILVRENPPLGEGAMGIVLAQTGVIKYPWYQAIWQGARQTAVLLVNTAWGYALIIKNLILTGSAGMQISGPVGIAKFAGQAARVGFIYLAQITALLSINLAILNIAPFPALDGGRLLFVAIEKIKGSPLPRRAETLVNSIGFILLIFLMIYITTKDILRVF